MTEHQTYVLCYAHPYRHEYWPEVLLIEKKRPTWQAGRLNLPGGHIEPNESILAAARRELYEETGIDCDVDDVSINGTIEGDGWTVYVCRCDYDSFRGKNVAESRTDETVEWMPVWEALRDDRLMDNLRIIIPLMRADLVGWSMKSELDSGTYLLTQDYATAKVY